MANIKTNPSTVAEKAKSAIGTYHLADNPNLYEVQRTNNYEFIVTDIDGILKAGFDGTESNAHISNAQELIRLAVTSATVPHFSQNSIEVKRGNSTLKYAGVPTFESGQITCNDFIGADVKAVLMAWQNLSYNVETEKVGLASDYKKDCYLVEYSPDYQVVRKWKLYGCWVSGLSEDSYDSETNTKKKISVSITYDKGKIDTSEEI